MNKWDGGSNVYNSKINIIFTLTDQRKIVVHIHDYLKGN